MKFFVKFGCREKDRHQNSMNSPAENGNEIGSENVQENGKYFNYN